jgi:hypothetical protein
MQVACHGSDGTIIADTNRDHGGSSGQAERRESFGLFISYAQTGALSYTSSYHNIFIFAVRMRYVAHNLLKCKLGQQASYMPAEMEACNGTARHRRT